MLSFQNVEPAKAFLAARQLGTHDSLLQTAWAAIIEWKGLSPAPDCGGRGSGVWVVTPALYLVSKTNFKTKFRGSSSTFFCKRLDAVQVKARRLTRCLLLSISGLGRNTAWQQQLQHLLFGSVFHCTSSWTVIYVSGKRWEVDIVLMQ